MTQGMGWQQAITRGLWNKVFALVQQEALSLSEDEQLALYVSAGTRAMDAG